jgi:hypothetical protein
MTSVSQLPVVVYLPVEHGPDRSVLVAQRLMPGLEVDDAQAAMAHAYPMVDELALVVRTAMHDGIHHPMQERLVLQPDESADAAHP